MSRLTDKELHCLTDLCRRSVEMKPNYRHGHQVLSALTELSELRGELSAERQARVNAEFQLLALQNPIPPEVRVKMDADRAKAISNKTTKGGAE